MELPYIPPPLCTDNLAPNPNRHPPGKVASSEGLFGPEEALLGNGSLPFALERDEVVSDIRWAKPAPLGMAQRPGA